MGKKDNYEEESNVRTTKITTDLQKLEENSAETGEKSSCDEVVARSTEKPEVQDTIEDNVESNEGSKGEASDSRNEIVPEISDEIDEKSACKKDPAKSTKNPGVEDSIKDHVESNKSAVNDSRNECASLDERTDPESETDVHTTKITTGLQEVEENSDETGEKSVCEEDMAQSIKKPEVQDTIEDNDESNKENKGEASDSRNEIVPKISDEIGEKFACKKDTAESTKNPEVEDSTKDHVESTEGSKSAVNDSRNECAPLDERTDPKSETDVHTTKITTGLQEVGENSNETGEKSVCEEDIAQSTKKPAVQDAVEDNAETNEGSKGEVSDSRNEIVPEISDEIGEKSVCKEDTAKSNENSEDQDSIKNRVESNEESRSEASDCRNESVPEISDEIGAKSVGKEDTANSTKNPEIGDSIKEKVESNRGSESVVNDLRNEFAQFNVQSDSNGDILFCAAAEIHRLVDIEWKNVDIGFLVLLHIRTNDQVRLRMINRSESHGLNYILTREIHCTHAIGDEKNSTFTTITLRSNSLFVGCSWETARFQFVDPNVARSFKESFDKAKAMISIPDDPIDIPEKSSTTSPSSESETSLSSTVSNPTDGNLRCEASSITAEAIQRISSLLADFSFRKTAASDLIHDPANLSRTEDPKKITNEAKPEESHHDRRNPTPDSTTIPTSVIASSEPANAIANQETFDGAEEVRSLGERFTEAESSNISPVSPFGWVVKFVLWLLCTCGSILKLVGPIVGRLSIFIIPSMIPLVGCLLTQIAGWIFKFIFRTGQIFECVFRFIFRMRWTGLLFPNVIFGRKSNDADELEDELDSAATVEEKFEMDSEAVIVSDSSFDPLQKSAASVEAVPKSNTPKSEETPKPGTSVNFSLGKNTGFESHGQSDDFSSVEKIDNKVFYDERSVASTKVSLTIGGIEVISKMLRDIDKSDERSENIVVLWKMFKPTISWVRAGNDAAFEERIACVYIERAKLFTYDSTKRAWRKGGCGNIKILQNRSSKKFQIVMRRDKTLDLCLNHVVNVDLELKSKDGKTWLWNAVDYSSGDIEHRQVACRFRSPRIAANFKSSVYKALEPSDPLSSE